MQRQRQTGSGPASFSWSDFGQTLLVALVAVLALFSEQLAQYFTGLSDFWAGSIAMLLVAIAEGVRRYRSDTTTNIPPRLSARWRS